MFSVVGLDPKNIGKTVLIQKFDRVSEFKIDLDSQKSWCGVLSGFSHENGKLKIYLSGISPIYFQIDKHHMEVIDKS